MKPYFIKTPIVIQRIFKNYSWRFSTTKSTEKIIYLTFDDGPTPEITAWTLATLTKYNAKATFFCLGKNIEKFPDIFQKIIADRHTIGNHTNNHLNGWKTDTTAYLKNVLKCEKLISTSLNQATNNDEPTTNHHQLPTNQQPATNLFRPPYGRIKPTQAKRLIEKGGKIIMWDVLSADFDQTISSEKCLDNVLKNTKNGSIVVFHDSVKAEKHLKFVLPKVLEYFSKKGYRFSSIALPS